MSFQLGAFQIPAFQSPAIMTPVGPVITAAWAFNPDLADAFEEAFERAGIAPLAIGQEHIASALRSCRYMLNSEWSTYGFRQWMVETGTYTTIAGTNNFDLPTGAVMVFNAMLRRQNADTQMYPISRSDYDAISTKEVRGRTNQFFIDQRYNALTMYLWTVPENNTDVIIYDYLRQMSDVGGMPSGLDMPAFALEAFIAGLAMNLARKFNLERYQMLRNEYGGPAYPEKLGGKLFHMRAASGERGDVQFTITRRR